MRFGGKTLICLLCAGALTTVQAVVNDAESTDPVRSGDSPYSAIWQRNVFDLKPIIIATIKDSPPPPAASNIQLKGITTILGRKQVLIDVMEGGGGKTPGKPESYIMAEGERQGGLEIVSIDKKTSTVQIKNEGVLSTITFSTNSATGGPPAMVGSSGPVRPGFVPPPATPGYNPAANGYTPTPVRPMRTDYSGGTQQTGYQPSAYSQPNYAQPVVQGGYGASVQGGSGVNLPGSLFNQPQSQPQQQTEDLNVSAEEKLALLAVQQQIHAAQIQQGTFPPFPPIPGIPQIPSGLATPQADTSEPSTGTAAPTQSPAFTPPLPPWLRSTSTGTLSK